MVITIYCDPRGGIIDASQFQRMSPALAHAQIIPYATPLEANPPFIQRLLRYDNPDIILVRDGIPVLVYEATHMAASGHNAGQRLARLACAMEEGVMAVYFAPIRSMKHGKNATRVFQPRRLISAIEAMRRIHGVPILFVNWAVDANDELIRDGGQLSRENGNFRVGLSELINDLITNDFDYSNCQTINNLFDRMLQLAAELNPGWNDPAPSVEIISTNEYLQRLRQRLPQVLGNIPATFRARKETLVYNIGITEIIGKNGRRNCDREDPFIGNQFQYDYQFCRNGINPNQKQTNLVLNFPHVHRAIFEQDNPNNPNLKSRVWYVTANLLEFTDGIITSIP